MKLHHVALSVPVIAPAVDWYTKTLNASVAYQDKTWALLEIENTSIALVLPSQHPPHVAFNQWTRKDMVTSCPTGTAPPAFTFKTRLGIPLSF